MYVIALLFASIISENEKGYTLRIQNCALTIIGVTATGCTLNGVNCTINYGDGTSDEITYVMKNYEHLDGTRSVKVYINGTQIKSSNYSVNITIVKPTDFLEN